MGWVFLAAVILTIHTNSVRLVIPFITGVGPEASDTTFAFYSHQEGELIKIKTFCGTVPHRKWFWGNWVGVSHFCTEVAGWWEAAPWDLPVYHLTQPEAPDPRALGCEASDDSRTRIYTLIEISKCRAFSV